jgi:hypothetical protein
MSGAVAVYLRKRAERDARPRIAGAIDGIEQAVVIPVLAEHPGLFQTLDDLAGQPAPERRRTLVVCVVNNRKPSHAAAEDIANNQRTLAALAQRARIDDRLRLAWIDASSPEHELGAKDGVGMARRLGLDWALEMIPAHGALISLDADTRVDANYLEAIRAFFASGKRWAAVFDYAHPLEGPNDETRAILCYEFFLRCHELGLAYAASPYAFPTIGSAIACTGHAYAAVSGMNRRQAGEDFYFLQQLAKTGPVERIAGTTVRPASRPSHRVPFGTGRRVRRFIEENEDEYVLYHPQCYAVLRAWLAVVVSGPDSDAEVLLTAANAIHPALAVFLREQGFTEAWPRLQAQHPDHARRLHRFHEWFDAFRTLKLIHHLRDHGLPQQEMFGAMAELLRLRGELPEPAPDAALQQDIDRQRRLLEQLRTYCRGNTAPRGLA